MTIRDTLLTIKTLANENHLSEPFIVGGMPRDKVLNKSEEINDLDLTSGDESIHKLAEITANYFKVTPIKFLDNHYQMYINGLKFDFSSNYQSPNVKYFIEKAGIKNPTEMQMELYSRDFTCNLLLVPMDLRKILDPTGLAFDDIKAKIIKTPLPPRITLSNDTNRVLRSIYLAAKLGFTVEKDIVRWVLRNHEKIKKEVSSGFSRTKLAAATKSNPEITVKLMNEMKLWNVVSIPTILVNTLKNHKGII